METLRKQLHEIENHLNSITSTIFHRIEGIEKKLEKIEEKTEKIITKTQCIEEKVETIERLCNQNRRRIFVLEDISNQTREVESVQQTKTKVFIFLIFTILFLLLFKTL